MNPLAALRDFARRPRSAQHPAMPLPLIEPLEDRRLLSAVVHSLHVAARPASPVTHASTAATPVGLTLTVPFGRTYTGPVAKWSGVVASSEDLHATIDWGDGTDVSTGTVVQDNSSTPMLQVIGTHRYTLIGTFNVTVHLTQSGGVSGTVVDLGTAHSNAIVAGRPRPKAEAAFDGVFNATANQPFTGTVAALRYRIANAPNSIVEYDASIDWGDGTTSPGTFAPNDHGGTNIIGTHTYTQPGRYVVTTTVTFGPRAGSGAEFPTRIIATLNSTAIVSGTPVVTGKAVQVDALAGQQFSGSVGTFVDPRDRFIAPNFFAFIDWGDGTTTQGKITTTSAGYEVDGSHTYAAPLTYTIHVSVYDATPGDPNPTAMTLFAAWDSTANVK